MPHSPLKPFPRRIGVGGFAFTASEKRYVEAVMESDVLTYGPLSQQLETRFAQAHQSKHAILCNSGTSALLVALACLKEVRGWDSATEVILPAVTFVATYNMVLDAGLTPVVADVDPHTYNLDPRCLEKAITAKTRCVMPVHLFGQPCNMGEIMPIVSRHRLSMVEDSAETMFACFDGTMVGTFGEFGCFSTYIAHILITGVGGIITTQSDDLALIARSLCNHGRDPRYISANVARPPSEPTSMADLRARFSFLRHGYSFRMTELESAVGLGQLDQMEDLLTKRRANAAALTEALKPYAHVLQLPTTHAKAEHSYMMYPVLVKSDRFSKWELMKYLEDLNIDTREMVPLINQPVYRGRFRAGDYPVASAVNERGFYLGCHPYLGAEEIAFQAQAIAAFIKAKGL